jgi:hypothetical protein
MFFTLFVSQRYVASLRQSIALLIMFAGLDTQSPNKSVTFPQKQIPFFGGFFLEEA